ncbi:MAG: hypothetical protein ACQKBV_05125 [Puniceicoccales bacterium]
MTDWTKVALSVIGAILLVALCVQLLLQQVRTAPGIVFAVAFLILLAYAFKRFAKKK